MKTDCLLKSMFTVLPDSMFTESPVDLLLLSARIIWDSNFMPFQLVFILCWFIYFYFLENEDYYPSEEQISLGYDLTL